MKTPTRALACAVASLFAGFAADAGAVALSPRGTGQVLLFPYYTVNGGNQTLLTLVNSTARAKALKVRFNEARNGRAVYELNLYLAAHDTWAAAVFANGERGVAKLAFNDASCTIGTPCARSSAKSAAARLMTGPQRSAGSGSVATLGSRCPRCMSMAMRAVRAAARCGDGMTGRLIAWGRRAMLA